MSTFNATRINQFCSRASHYADALVAQFAHFEINTALRQAHCLAQIAHESGGFAHLAENLNYSADALRRVWPRRFTSAAVANSYARQPERIANRVYANRLGNAAESSGEGWRYRGRGLIQLTGKDNYRRASLALYGDAHLINVPDEVALPAVAAATACWFWHDAQLNPWADRDDLLMITKRINGGTTGLEDRREWLERAKQIAGL